MSRQDKLSARVYAGRMKQFNETGEVYIGDSMRVDFYNDEGRHTSFLKSDSGIVNEKKQNLIAIGNVEFRERDTLYGTGFRSDVRLENWTIDKPRGSTRREYDVED
ncbi:MAG: hypothetical protein XE04_1967 [Marinimicrobia bacterium 46_43]|nr:MAG: hypothetical protein XE04_1967 [Marinimicrobia bacterium 46_43]